MPADDYVPVGGGALKLKGAKVEKKKKKKSKKPDLEKNLTAPSEESDAKSIARQDQSPTAEDDRTTKEEDSTPESRKTAAELRYEEFKRKRLLKMAEQEGSRPELMKTHKERVEELNTYLSKLSEHHDMPKIGPG
ncbi:uncharacterized protein F5Z01DRAFT_677427 [Emericellopsis atlantica]|uniref:DUF1754-domain-containing protein n=1 Tax=Emericellopsis atlantica TaxID=2614577 RepID=A0A9P7ZFE3_9HYPO|nr:uncharacterized protein F5Z01DRAFT_677427 [Emericellopsis atlantica]KAG9250931.1 hypothetical protein F5Z01DRAFT_677427 [Emericellopsis atlantica]